MSGSVEKLTTSAGCPVATARLCEPDAPNDCVNVTPLPALDCPNAVVRASNAFFGVEYATSASWVDDPPELELEPVLAALLVVSADPPQPASTVAPRAATATAPAALNLNAFVIDPLAIGVCRLVL
jgi:hypothetical protein